MCQKLGDGNRNLYLACVCVFGHGNKFETGYNNLEVILHQQQEDNRKNNFRFLLLPLGKKHSQESFMPHISHYRRSMISFR